MWSEYAWGKLASTRSLTIDDREYGDWRLQSGGLDGSGVDIELAADDGCGVKVAESGRDLYSALD